MSDLRRYIVCGGGAIQIGGLLRMGGELSIQPGQVVLGSGEASVVPPFAHHLLNSGYIIRGLEMQINIYINR